MIASYRFFRRADNELAHEWQEKIRTWAGQKFPDTKEDEKNFEAVLVLGGDGTILEAARVFHGSKAVIFGLNLGTVGFLASVRQPENFFTGLEKFFSGAYKDYQRMVLAAEVQRQGSSVFKGYALNDIVVQNLLGMVELNVHVDGHPIQSIRGSGVLVATATGTTAYNLSAHGPVLMPEIKGMVITELLDHNIPTPSLVVKDDKTITVEIVSFRRRGLLSVTESGEPVDVLLLADTEQTFVLEEHDRIMIQKSPYLVRFAEVEDSYFFKSLEEKFAFE